jgi:hypothetical protein
MKKHIYGFIGPQSRWLLLRGRLQYARPASPGNGNRHLRHAVEPGANVSGSGLGSGTLIRSGARFIGVQKNDGLRRMPSKEIASEGHKSGGIFLRTQ